MMMRGKKETGTVLLTVPVSECLMQDDPHLAGEAAQRQLLTALMKRAALSTEL